MTQEQYLLAKTMYINQGLSLAEIGKKLHIDRGNLSKKLKQEGIEVINKQHQVHLDQTFFDVIDTEEKAYWLGFFYADGYVSKTDYGIELSLKLDDYHHIEKLLKSLQSDKKIITDDHRCRLCFRNKHMHESLIKQGCVPQKSLILTFPSKDQVPNNLIIPFIRGYIDGDGSIMYGKNQKTFRLSILGTELFLNTLIEKMKWEKHKFQSAGQAFSVEWAGAYTEKYVDSVYQNANIYLDRKYQKYLEIKNAIAVH